MDDLSAPSFSMALPVGWACPERRCNSRSEAIRSIDSSGSQTREMDSSVADRASRAIMWLWQPIMGGCKALVAVAQRSNQLPKHGIQKLLRGACRLEVYGSKVL